MMLHYNFVFFLSAALFSLIIVTFVFFFVKKKDVSLWFLTAYFSILALWTIGWTLFYFAPTYFVGLVGSLFTNSAVLAPYFFIQFIYNFPYNTNKKESQIVSKIFLFLTISYLLFSMHHIAREDIKYNFEREIFKRVDTKQTDIPYMVLLLSQYFWCIFTTFRKNRELRHLKESKAMISFGLASFFQLLLAFSYVLQKVGFLTTETYFLSINIGSQLILLYITIAYLNHSIVPSTVMIKIVGISLVAILTILGIMARFSFSFVEKSFHRELETIKRQLIVSVFSNNFNQVDKSIDYILCTQSEKNVLVYETKQFQDFKNKALSPEKMYSQKFIDDPKFAYILFHFTVDNQKYQAGIQYLYYRKNIVAPPSIVFSLIILFTSLFMLLFYPLLFYKSLYKPLNYLLKGLKEVDKGNLKIQIPIFVKDEIGFLVKTFNRMVDSLRVSQHKLKEYSENLETMVGDRTKELNDAYQTIKNKQKKIDKELNIASEIQNCILPPNFMQLENFSMTYCYQPLNKVGGDFLDVLELQDNSIGVLVVDASGHGIPAALLTTLAKLSFVEACVKHNSLKDIFSEVNRSWMTIMQNQYLTAFMIKIFPDYRIEYSCAGHRDMLVYRRKKGIFEKWTTEGTFIGALEGAELFYEVKESILYPGDRLLLYTDGLTESFDIAQNMYSEERLLEIFQSTVYMSIQESIDYIKKDWLSFLGNNKQEDDVTIISLEIT
ncbi:MAG: SpoIIE family protein phosphatase [Leptospiraceae bacterium]|nr:SpoIIE family protein phosphatase [Leptospiraceae bacterium]